MAALADAAPQGGQPTSMFAEPLPPQCPPTVAVEPHVQLALRLAKTNQPTRSSFDSHAKKRIKVRFKVDPCEYASCSLYQHDAADEQLNAMRDIPKFRNFTHAFIVEIGPGTGRYLVKESKHIDFWMYASFDPVAAVKGIRVFHG